MRPLVRKISSHCTGRAEFYRARWYDADIGRFISPDNAPGDPASPQSFNRYSYVLNNPYAYVDPTGDAPVRFGNRTFNVFSGDVMVMKLGGGNGIHTATFSHIGPGGEVMVYDSNSGMNQTPDPRLPSQKFTNDRQAHAANDIMASQEENGMKTPNYRSPENGAEMIGVVDAAETPSVPALAQGAAKTRENWDENQCYGFSKHLAANTEGYSLRRLPGHGTTAFESAVDKSREVYPLPAAHGHTPY